jgi:hypothetical protein
MVCLFLSIDNIKQYEFIEISKENGLYLIDRKDYFYHIKISSLTLKSACNHFHYVEEDEKFILYPTNEELHSLSLTATEGKARKRKFESNIPINENIIKNYIEHIIKYFKLVLKYDITIEIVHNSQCMYCENDISEIITIIKLPLIEIKRLKTNATIKRLRHIFKPILLLKNKLEIESIIEKLVIIIYSKFQLYYMQQKSKSMYIGFILILTIVNGMNKNVSYQQDFPTEIFEILCNGDNNNDNNKLFEKMNNCLKKSINYFTTYIMSQYNTSEGINISNIGIKLINNNTVFASTITYSTIEFNKFSDQEDFKIYTHIKNIPILYENNDDICSSNAIDIIPEISLPNTYDTSNLNIYNIPIESKSKKYSIINDNNKSLQFNTMKPIIFSELLLQLLHENSIKNFITHYKTTYESE